jgi:futalosine hydrolase
LRILLVAATSEEIAPLVARLSRASDSGGRLQHSIHGNHYVDVLTTGVGMVATAAWCCRTLASATYDLALNFGVCGTFDRSLQPGTVVHVVADRLAELGAEDRDAFLTVQQLHLLGDDEFPFTRGELVNAHPPANAVLTRLPTVNGITVNTVHGNARSIATVTARFTPRVESMEGAAFMYACLINNLPFAQVRAVSNVVEPRNRDAWRLADAIRYLGETAISILEAA